VALALVGIALFCSGAVFGFAIDGFAEPVPAWTGDCCCGTDGGVGR
jgi:hypothetical protein